MQDLVPMEVFAAGRAAGREWTTDHLDEMVANFAALKDHVKPMVKLGHDGKQILAQRDGQPALGWVKDLKRQGDKLVAFVAQMPKFLKDAVSAGRWQRVSSEIFTQFENTSAAKNIGTDVKGHVLSAVALLGADAPEVKSLADLELLLSDGDVPVTCADSACETEATAVEFAQAPVEPAARIALQPSSPPRTVNLSMKTCPECGAECSDDASTCAKCGHEFESEGQEMTEKEVNELLTLKLSEATAAIEAKAAKDAEALKAQVTKLSEDNARLEAAAAAAREDARRQAAEARADKLVAEFSAQDNYRLTPAMQPVARALAAKLGDGVLVKADEAAVLFSEKDTVDLNAHDLLRKLFTAMPDHKHLFSEQMHAAKPDDTMDAWSYAQSIAPKHGLDWAKREDRIKAVELASKERPDLVSRDRA